MRLLGASIIDLCTGMLSYIILLMDPDSQFPKVDHIYSVLFLVLMFSLFSLSPLSYSLLSPAYLSALLSLDLLFLILSPLPLILLFSLSLCTTLSLSFYLLSISFSLCLCVFSLCILLSLSLSISSPFPSLFVSVFFLSAYRSLSFYLLSISFSLCLCVFSLCISLSLSFYLLSISFSLCLCVFSLCFSPFLPFLSHFLVLPWCIVLSLSLSLSPLFFMPSLYLSLRFPSYRPLSCTALSLALFLHILSFSLSISHVLSVSLFLYASHSALAYTGEFFLSQT